VIKLIESLTRRSAKGFDDLCDRLAPLARDTRGNIMVFMAISLIALGTATGVGIDFARGLNFKSDLQGAVDSAAIAGAALYLNNGYASEATSAATDYFNKASSNLPTNNGVTPTITVSASAPWTVTVTATASIKSTFNGLFENTLPVTVSATANGPTNPNIDFYLLLDSSPSMAIAATQAGITTMVANTSAQSGCAFGCHESDPSADNLGNAAVINNGVTCTPAGEDNYTLARCLGVTLRIDNLTLATENLMTTAQTTMTSESAVYRVAIYTFDIAFNTIQTLTGSMSTAQSSAANIAMLEVYKNNWLTSSNNNSDADTNYDNAMTNINTTMPNPGNGTNATGDTPQEVLMFVTDGVEDEIVNGSRQQSLMSTSWCNTIKNRGIRIAVLYTVYYPLPTNSWYNTYISPFQANIGTNLQSCASPGLYFSVSTGGDISAAMTALFTSAVKTAYVSK
jgi:Flp pilus assembly protein TadG